jgi:hypothetical protein
MRRALSEDFCREYGRELNRLRMEHRAGLSSARTELAAVEREIRRLVPAIKDGVSALSIKESSCLSSSEAELQSRLNAPELPALLHPRRPTSIARRSEASVPRWRARGAARPRERPSER